MALTFDDLPYVAAGQRDTLERAQRVTSDILRVLKAHGATAVGFVNEGKLQINGEVAARTALLQQWIDAGAALGNHTYSHPDLNALTVQAFEADIVRGETVTRRLIQARPQTSWYFRHPQTHTGDTPEKKAAIDAFLESRGYTIAPHTIETSDFIFNAGFVRARNGGDQPTADRLRASYLDFCIAATAFAERASSEIFGREIPQTILLHANDLTADSLDDLLQRFEQRGYRFVSLNTAMWDPAYRTRDTLVSKSGPTWLWRWMRSLGLSVSFRDDPEPPGWVMDLYRAGQSR